LQQLLEGRHETLSKKKTIDCSGGVIGCICLTRFQINDFEFVLISRGTDDIESLVSSLRSVKSILDADHAAFRVQHVKYLDSVIIPDEKEREFLSVIARYLVKFEVKRVGAMLRYTPGNLRCNQLLRSVDHVKLLIVLDTDYELIRLVLDASRDVPVCKVSLSERHDKFKRAFCLISLEFAEEHSVVPTEADLSLSRRHDNVEDCVHLQRLSLQDFAHSIDFNDINVTEMLTEDYELFLDTILIVFKDLNVVDALLQFLVILLFKSVNIENKEMAIVAADPRQIVVHSTAEKPMTTRLLDYYGTQVLIIHMQLVAFASREDQA